MSGFPFVFSPFQEYFYAIYKNIFEYVVIS